MKHVLILLSLPFLLLGGEPVWLTWQQDPSTTMTIQWLNQDENDQIRFHGPGEDWQTAAGTHAPLPYDKKTFVHRAQLEGLKPATAYTFSVGKKQLRFRTLPETLDTPLRFVSGGDMYADKTPERMIETSRQAAKTNPAFAIIGGDIAYSSSSFRYFKEDASRWLTWLDVWFQEMVTPDGFLIPMIPAIGNHDVNGRFGQTPAEAEYFYTLFPMKDEKAYRSLSFGNYLLLILLDSDHTASVSGAQTDWLKKTLQDNTLPLTFAVYHVPAYPSFRSFNNQHSKTVRTYWAPLFDAYHLDVALEHHDHTYKRSYKLKGNKIDSKGTLYLGDGAWSPDKIRNPKKLPWYVEKFSSARHFLLITLSKEGPSFQAISSEGKVLDSF